MLTKSCEKVAPNFYCENCDYSTDKKSSFNKHLLTAKHQKLTKVNKSCQESCQNSYQNNCQEQSTILLCDNCSKPFKSRVGIWKHKKMCIANNEELKEPKTIDNELIMTLIKENTEFKNIIVKLIQNGTTSNINANNNNVTNNIKTFNLNFYLNETCKDAINISDFVSSIKVNLEDLENTGRQGYIQGISKIFMKNLNNLEHHFRPIHCSDLKLEVFYIKDNNEWTKEGEDKPILTKAIKTIANENIKQIKYWRDKYPDCTDSESKKNNLYLKIVSNSMNGLTKEESDKNINKIISNLSKEVIIDKYD